MIGVEELAQACFDGDSLADEGVPFEDIVRDLGLDLQGMAYVAKQRALSIVLGERGPEEQKRVRDQAYVRKFSIEHLTKEELGKQQLVAAAWLDAALAMARALKETST